jgi:uncharacterized protein YeaO (DUF488 family)
MPQGDDIGAGHGREGHKRIIRQIAVYEAIGNRDGAEILTAHLRALGVDMDQLREDVMWTRIEAPSPGAPARTHHRNADAFPNRAASNLP